MDTIACGIDMVEIERLRSIKPEIRSRFLTRVFSPQEILDCAGREDRLAARFAVKEATVKALGCGIGVVGWQDIQTCLDENGKPELVLKGEASAAAKRANWCSWSVSISHTREFAIACVTAIAENN